MMDWLQSDETLRNSLSRNTPISPSALAVELVVVVSFVFTCGSSPDPLNKTSWAISLNSTVDELSVELEQLPGLPPVSFLAFRRFAFLDSLLRDLDERLLFFCFFFFFFFFFLDFFLSFPSASFFSFSLISAAASANTGPPAPTASIRPLRAASSSSPRGRLSNNRTSEISSSDFRARRSLQCRMPGPSASRTLRGTYAPSRLRWFRSPTSTGVRDRCHEVSRTSGDRLGLWYLREPARNSWSASGCCHNWPHLGAKRANPLAPAGAHGES